MLSIFIFLYIILLIGITIFFINSLKASGLPPNTQLLVDVWNSISELN